MSKPSINIRAMQVDDIPAVVALGTVLFSADKSPTLYRCWEEAEVLRIYQASKETCLVADRNGRIIGFALGSLLEKPGTPWKYGWLDWLGVSPRYRRKRVSSRLVKQLQSLFVERSVRIMLVDTYEKNQRALNFFKKIGFDQEIRHIYMSLNLDNHPDAMSKKSDED